MSIIFPTDTAWKTPIGADIIPVADSAASNALKEVTVSDLWTFHFNDKTTTDLAEWTNLYYTEARVSANTDVAANTSDRHSHSNKAVLDATTASFTTADEALVDWAIQWPWVAIDNSLARFNWTTGKLADTWKVTQDDFWNLSNIDWADFDLTPTATTHTPWRLRWNAEEHTLDLDTDFTDNSLQINQETVTPFINNTGSTIANWSVVRFTWATAWWIVKVGLAASDNIDNVSWNLFVTTTATNNWQEWMMTSFGKLRGIDTSTMSVWDPLYLSDTTPWLITNVRPEYPNYIITIGWVVTSAVDWVIWVGQTTYPRDTIFNSFVGAFLERIDFLITSDWLTITGTLNNVEPTDNLTAIWGSWLETFDTTTTPISVTLTAWTDTNPQANYIYIPKSTKTLTTSTTWFPEEEHIKIAFAFVQSETWTQTNWALINQNWNDAIKKTWDNGHILHLSERLRQIGAAWDSGTEWSSTIVGWTEVYVAVTGWTVYQLHKQTFPTIDTQTTWDVHIVNDSVAEYKTLSDIAWQTTDASWNTLLNSSFSFVLWGVQNKTWEESHLMINLPTDSYSRLAPDNAVSDANNYAVYEIPTAFKSTGFLIARFTYTLTSWWDWALYDTEDLRGRVPNSTAWGWWGWTWVTTFTWLSDTPSAYTWEALKLAQVNAWETALEFIDNSALNTATDTTTFNNNLSAADTDVQKALETIDDISFSATDTDAIHVNVAWEINTITEKASPVWADWIVIEDSADINNKKKIQVGNLPTAWGWEANTTSNGWTGWVGIVLPKVWIDLPFKSINAGSAKITVTDDAVNSNIDVDVAEANLTLSNMGWVVSDAQVANDITLDNITQITNRSHTWLSDIWTNSHSQIDSHISNVTTNPHAVTATNVWLGNVDNTSDATKNSTVATLTNKSLQDSTTDFIDELDATKKFKFQASWITTDTTRTLTVLNKDYTVWDVDLDSTQTLTNKTLTGTNNTLTASLLKSSTTEVSVSAATAPTTGQVLTATSWTTATWQDAGWGSASFNWINWQTIQIAWEVVDWEIGSLTAFASWTFAEMQISTLTRTTWTLTITVKLNWTSVWTATITSVTSATNGRYFWVSTNLADAFVANWVVTIESSDTWTGSTNLVVNFK